LIRTALAAFVLLALALPAVATAADPVIAAAGDIACDPTDPNWNGGEGNADGCRQKATSDLLLDPAIVAVLPLGDIQYNSPTPARIAASYDPTWGRVKSISHPTVGNHEGSGTAYYDYFNGVGVNDGPAGPRGKGWYSFDVGTWHLVSLNSNCSEVDCTAGSEQLQWLRADLAAHPAECTLAFWHHARYSSGHDEDNEFTQPFWDALADAQAEIVLSGHSHDYERFAPMDRNGNLDQANGIRQFVVGTGGAFFTGGLGSLMPNSEVAQNDSFGVLKLTLHPASYDWQFVPAAGGTFTDSGTTACHPPPPPPPPPDVTPPAISGVTVRPPAIVSTGTLSFHLSEPATVRVRVKRRVKGRLVGGRCRPATRANRRKRPCRRYRQIAVLTHVGVAGRNSRRIRPAGQRRRPVPGVYRAGLRAIDAAGNRSAVRTVRFRVVRR
jgi:hypothetical protein